MTLVKILYYTPVVLNTGLLDWEPSSLTSRPLIHKHFSLAQLKH